MSDLVLIKTCSKCGEIKAKTEFSKHGKRLRSECKSCQAEYVRNWRKANKEWVQNHNKAEYIKGSTLIKESKQRPCTDCKRKYPYYVMQFDHVRGEKLFAVARARRRSQKQILDEIAKCDLVCANCHAERTYQRIKARCSN